MNNYCIFNGLINRQYVMSEASCNSLQRTLWLRLKKLLVQNAHYTKKLPCHFTHLQIGQSPEIRLRREEPRCLRFQEDRRPSASRRRCQQSPTFGRRRRPPSTWPCSRISRSGNPSSGKRRWSRQHPTTSRTLRRSRISM